MTQTSLAVLEAGELIGSPTAPTNDQALRDWLATKSSPNTRDLYGRAVREFLAVAGNLPLGLIGRSQLADYAAAATAALDSGAAPASVSVRIQAVRGFLRWCHEEELFEMSPARVARMLQPPKIGRQKQFTVLTDTQATELLASAFLERDRAILAVMLGGGLRRAEAAALNVSDLAKDTSGRLRLTITSKGRRTREILLPPSASAAVLAYLAGSRRTLNPTMDSPLFLSAWGPRQGMSRLTPRGIGVVMAGVCKRAGIEGRG